MVELYDLVDVIFYSQMNLKYMLDIYITSVYTSNWSESICLLFHKISGLRW